MGMFHAKCECCWDPLPCQCEKQRERDQRLSNSPDAERDRLLREQNKLLREIAQTLKESRSLS